MGAFAQLSPYTVVGQAATAASHETQKHTMFGNITVKGTISLFIVGHANGIILSYYSKAFSFDISRSPRLGPSITSHILGDCTCASRGHDLECVCVGGGTFT